MKLRRVIDRLVPQRPAPPDARAAVHFLHIGKTAGTQIIRLCARWNEGAGPCRFVPHPHWVRLRGLPEGESYFFSIRLPHTRFRSGFYGRKRKDLPLTHLEWTDNEARAFADFAHANDLAEALSDRGERGRSAVSAMKSISHVRTQQIDWITPVGYFLDLRPPIAIIRQENFKADIDRLLQRTGTPAPPPTSKPTGAVHANDYEGTPDLSALALDNLFHWYRQDYAFYDLCQHWIERQE